jgi:hypothetical protein
MAKGHLPAYGFVFSVLVAIPMVGHAQQRVTLGDGDVIRGQLGIVKTKHPNGTRIEAFQIVNDAGYFLKEDEDCDARVPLRKFHVVPRDGQTKTRLQRSLGKVVSIRGRQFYCAHTAWHIGDAVALDSEIVSER